MITSGLTSKVKPFSNEIELVAFNMRAGILVRVI